MRSSHWNFASRSGVRVSGWTSVRGVELAISSARAQGTKVVRCGQPARASTASTTSTSAPRGPFVDSMAKGGKLPLTSCSGGGAASVGDASVSARALNWRRLQLRGIG